MFPIPLAKPACGIDFYAWYTLRNCCKVLGFTKVLLENDPMLFSTQFRPHVMELHVFKYHEAEDQHAKTGQTFEATEVVVLRNDDWVESSTHLRRGNQDTTVKGVGECYKI